PPLRLFLLPLLLLVSLSAPVAAQETVMTWARALDQPPEWYGSADAVRNADNLLAYQHPSGGWGKNIDMARPLDAAELRRVREESQSVETLIDNGATHRQLRFLARVHSAVPTPRLQAAFLRG